MRAPEIVSAVIVPAKAAPGDTATLTVAAAAGRSDDDRTDVYDAANAAGERGTLTVAWHAPDAVINPLAITAASRAAGPWDERGTTTDQDRVTAVFTSVAARPEQVGVLAIDTVTAASATTTAELAVTPARRTGACTARTGWAANPLGPSPTHRIFYTGELPAVFDPAGAPPGTVVIVSYKTRGTNVAAYFGSVPGDYEVWGCWHHEPEDDMTGDAFVTRFAGEAKLIRAANPAVKVIMISGGYQYRAGSTNADALAGKYFTGIGEIADLVGLDQYQGRGGYPGDGKSNYDWTPEGLATNPAFQNRLRRLTDPAIVGTVPRVAVTEYGIAALVGDERRAARIAADAEYVRKTFGPGNPLECWSYWQVPPKTTETDTRLTGAPAALWRQLEAGTA